MKRPVESRQQARYCIDDKASDAVARCSGDDDDDVLWSVLAQLDPNAQVANSTPWMRKKGDDGGGDGNIKSSSAAAESAHITM